MSSISPRTRNKDGCCFSGLQPDGLLLERFHAVPGWLPFRLGVFISVAVRFGFIETGFQSGSVRAGSIETATFPGSVRGSLFGF